MALFLPQRWRRQPQGPVDVDWSNPLTRGLLVAHSIGSRRADAVGLGYSTPTYPHRATGPGLGLALTEYSALPYGIQQGTRSGPAGVFYEPTMAWVVTYTGARNDGSWRGFGWVRNSNGGTISVGADTSNNLHANGLSDSGVQVLPGSPTPGRYVIGMVGAGGTTGADGAIYWENRRRSVSVANWRLGDPADGAVAPSYGGFRTDAPPEVYPFIYLGLALWYRRLSDGEWLSFQENPWQIFRPQNSPIISLSPPRVIKTATIDTAGNATGTIELTPTDLANVSAWPWTPRYRITSL